MQGSWGLLFDPGSTLNSEVYFPLSPKYLAYLHFNNSIDKKKKLRQEKRNTVIVATDEQNIRASFL